MDLYLAFFSLLYIQMYILILFIFVSELYYLVNRQLITTNYILNHKNKYTDVLTDIKKRDRRKWVYNLIN